MLGGMGKAAGLKREMIDLLCKQAILIVQDKATNLGFMTTVFVNPKK